MKKRVFSWFMAAAMVMSLIPGAAFATSEQSAGDESAAVAAAAAVTSGVKIGDVLYADLAEAVAAANSGDTITLQGDTAGAGVVINKSLTIDLGGFTYTFTSGVGSTGTESNGLQVLKGNNVIVKNGKLDVAAEAKVDFYILIQNYADLTVDGVVLDGTNLDKWSGTDGDSYTLSNNSGAVVIKDTTIIANDEGDKAFAFDVFENSGYTVPDVTVTGDCQINGTFDVSGIGSATLTISGGTFVNDPTPYLAEGFAAVKDGETWTVNDNRVAQIGDTKYATLAQAVAVGGNITLLKDVQLDAAIEVSNTVVIDLAGFDISMTEKDTSGDGVFHVVSGGALTIGGEGTVSGTSGGNNYDMAIWADGGDVVINGGTYTNVGAGSDDHYDLIYAKNGGTVTINGGTFECQTPDWILNLKDKSTSFIVVKGGTFVGFNPAEAYTEPAPSRPISYVASGYHVKESAGSYIVCSNADIVGNEYTLTGDITVTSGGIVVDADTTVNLAGFTISAPADTAGDGVFHVTGGTLTINGDGTVNGLGNNNYSMAIWADGGNVVINGGTYTNVGAGSDDHYDLIYAKNGSTVIITDGTFQCHTPAWTLNLKDGSGSSIVVKGGAFKGFDPANGTTENPAVDFVAAGHISELSGENYVVSPVTYTVTFMDGETQLNQKGINHGVAINEPADPAKDGFTFDGWYSDSALTTAYDFTTPVTGDITLYAKWTVVPVVTPDPEPDYDYTPVRPSNPTVDKETVKNQDGSTTITETKKDGTVIETTKTTDGTIGTTTVDPDGTVTVEADISKAAAEEAAESDTVVTLPIAPLALTDDTDEAAAVKIDIPAGTDSITVEIPVENVTPGTVVILVDEKGNETVVNTTGTTENGVVVEVKGDVTVKVVDNSKDFEDVSGNDWFEDAADFVSARGLMNGMTEDTFGHGVPTSRAMVAQILHNMEGKADHDFDGSFADVDSDAWYADAIYWAADEGIISGVGNGNFAPDDYITREQLALMMWKYAGAEVSNYDIASFKDCDQISAYAEMAIRWAVENGLMSGKGNGQLDPKGNATRAEVASVLMKFYENVKY